MKNCNDEPAGNDHDPALPEPLFLEHKMHAGVKRELTVVNRAIIVFWLLCGVSMLVGLALLLFIIGIATGIVASNDLLGPVVLTSGVVVAALLMLAPVIFRRKLTTLKKMKAAVLDELQFYRAADRPPGGRES
jgi:hypothetical protein